MRYFPLSVRNFAAFRRSTVRWLAYFWPIPHRVDTVLGDLQHFGRAFVEFSPKIRIKLPLNPLFSYGA